MSKAQASAIVYGVLTLVAVVFSVVMIALAAPLFDLPAEQQAREYKQ